MKIIPRPVHAVMDYAYGAAALAAPKVLGFQDDDKARLAGTAVGVVTLVSALTTRHEGGVVKLLPFNTHLKLDALTSLVALASPWLLGFSGNAKARNAMIGFAVIATTVVALSQPDEEA